MDLHPRVSLGRVLCNLVPARLLPPLLVCASGRLSAGLAGARITGRHALRVQCSLGAVLGTYQAVTCVLLVLLDCSQFGVLFVNDLRTHRRPRTHNPGTKTRRRLPVLSSQASVAVALPWGSEAEHVGVKFPLF